MRQKIIHSLLSIVLVLLLALGLILASGAEPILAFRYFMYGIFGSLNGFVEILVQATPYIFLGLGVSTAFRSGFFNIGGEGQFYMGALSAAMITILVPIAPVARIILAIVVAFVSGGVWAFIPAYLKNKMGISETVNTIMFNYIAIMLLGIAVRGVLQDPGDYLPQSAKIDVTLPLLLPPTRLHLGFILAFIAAGLMWFLIIRTTLGYELKVCGRNPRSAFCLGVPVGRTQLIAAALSGGLAGVAGVCELIGVQHRLVENLSGGKGYNAILIALLASNHPVGVVVVSLCFAAMQVGANTMQRQMGIPSSIVSILTGFIVLLILCKDFWKIHLEHKSEKGVRK